jgi:ABC-2 type transport system permease protein
VASLTQVLVIFALGVFLFPHIGLPPLEMPSSMTALFLVSIASGLCAVSYALAIGVWAETEEQANGFGAVSIVIFAALGGILVPAFAMPQAFQTFTVISPLFWCLQGFYELFLNGIRFPQILQSLLPIVIFIAILQSVSFFGMKRNNLF